MVYIPPERVLKLSRANDEDYGVSPGLAQIGRDSVAARKALSLALAEKEDDGDDGGIFGAIKSAASTALGALDTGRAALVATGHQLGLGLRNAVYGEHNKMGVDELIRETQDHIGAGDVVEEAFPDMPLLLKRALGGTLDVAADPLNALTLGSGSGAKALIGVVGREAPEAALALRRGIPAANEVLAERFAQGEAARVAEAAAQPFKPGLWAPARDVAEAPTVESLLRANVNPLAKRGVDETVARQLSVLEKRAPGGIGVGGYSTGIGQGFADDLLGGLRKTQVAKGIRPLFSTTADVLNDSDVYVAQAVDDAIHTGGNARRDFMRVANETADVPDDVYKQAKTAALDSSVDAVVERVPRIVRTAPEVGFTEVRDGVFLPDSVARTLKKSNDLMPSEALKGLDAGLSWLKRYTTLGPLNAVPHVGRNIMSNHLFASMFGGVTNPKYFYESGKLRRAVGKVIEAGEELTPENLVANGLSDTQAARALAMDGEAAFEGIKRRGESVYDDVGGEDQVRKDLLGTRTASKVNGWHEELSRGAVMLKAMDDGLSPVAAARRARDAMLDYSNEGLTQTEQKYLQRIVFFYKFPRRAIPAGLRFMVETPGLAKSASRIGIGVSENARNEYGDPIGTYMDTPLESVVQNLNQIVTDPIGTTNPLIKYALDKDSRSFTDLVPIFGQAERKLDDPKDAIYSAALGAVGARPGKDYATSRAKADFERSKAEREARGQDLTPTDKLRALGATTVLGDKAYAMSAGKLAQELIDLGVSRRRIGLILANRV